MSEAKIRALIEETDKRTRDDFHSALTAAVMTATHEIAQIRADGQKQLDALRRDLDELRDRFDMVSGSNGGRVRPR
jgi:hypothetical protein